MTELVHAKAYYKESDAITIDVWIKMVPGSGTQIEVWSSERLAYKTNEKYLGIATWDPSYKWYNFTYLRREWRIS